MSFLPLVVISLAVVFVAVLGSIFTSQGLNTWYPNLIKPEWMPPAALFGPVWTVLYGLIIVAISRIWYRLKASPRRAELLGLFFLNGIGNLLWSYFFFSLGWLTVALADLILVLITGLMLVMMLWKTERWAAVCLVPYVLWLGFAAVLNYQIVLLNPF